MNITYARVKETDMKRVTIRQLMYECTQPMSPDDYAKIQKILDVEITPRKAIEMIIERCDEMIDDMEKSIAFFKEIAYFDEACDAIFEANIRKTVAISFKTYTESLLERFEEDREDDKN